MTTSKRNAGKVGLAEALRAEVERRGTTLERASLDAGLNGNSFSRWNNGIEPGAEYYALLMDFLGVSLAELGELIVVGQLKRAGLPLL